MKNPNRNLFRDVVFITLPLAALLVLFVVASVASVLNSEVRGFHGFHLSAPRVGGVSQFFRYTEESLLAPAQGVFLSDQLRESSPIEILDLRVDGADLDQLSASLPASGKEWVKGALMIGGKPHEVEVRYRGSRFSNFIFREKGWKIRTPREHLIDGRRELNLERKNFNRHLGYLVSAEFGIPTPKSRLVRLFINQEDQGVYVDEEAVSELMMRQNSFMPGDIFYGELDIHSNTNAGLASNDLFWNPYLWDKKYLYNRYPEEYRENLCVLIEAIDQPGFAQLYSIIDVDEFARFFAALTFLGDSHTDKAHNHRLYFNPLSGEFSAIPWDLIRGISDPEGVEPIGNRLYRKLCSDPRFLDQVMQHVHSAVVERGVGDLLVAEIERVQESVSPSLADPDEFRQELEDAKKRFMSRTADIKRSLGMASVSYQTAPQRLIVHATAPGTLQMKAIQFDRVPVGVTIYEDRDFNGVVSSADRKLTASVDEATLSFDQGVDLFPGRDFTASYFQQHRPDLECYAAHREYSRLAALKSVFLIDSVRSENLPDVIGLEVHDPLSGGNIVPSEGAPAGHIASETIHPWTDPIASESENYRFDGEVELLHDLIVGENDSLEIAPGSIVRLGPGVSIHSRSAVSLNGVTFERLVKDRPWGVFVLQGKDASGSSITNCDFSGGSEDTIQHVYYSGMLSVHMARDVVLKDSRFSDNILGDDTVRFADCHDLWIDGVVVTNANGDAIDCDISTGRITNTKVITPQNDGIDLMTAIVDLQNVQVNGAGDKGISFGENASPVVKDCEMRDCVIGVAFKDGSNPTLTNVVISNCRTGVSGYAKNWRYPGGGQGKLVNCVLEKNGVDVLLDANSSLVLEKCSTENKYSVPESRLDYLIEKEPRVSQ